MAARVLDEIGDAIEALLGACASPDANVGSLLREAELRVGDIPVRSALPRIWRVPAGREAVLDYLYANGWYEEYLRRSRDYIVERLIEGDPLPPWYLDRYASEHLMHGAGDIFIEFIGRFPALTGQGRTGRGRILAALGRVAEAREALAGAEASVNPYEVFALGWIEFHLGDRDTAAALRTRIETLESDRVRRQLAAWCPEDAAPSIARGTPIATAIPFLDASVCSHDPALAAKIAAAIRNCLARCAGPATAPPAPITVEHWNAADMTERAALAAAGLNPAALALMTADSETLEILTDAAPDSAVLAGRMPRLADEDFYQGFWGQPPTAVARSIHLLRGVGLHGGLRALCPWSGAPLVSTESHCFSGFFAYRYEGAHEFWIIAAPLMFRRSWLWWPGADVLIGLGPTFPTGDMRVRLQHFREFLTARRDDVRRYRDMPRRLAVITGLEPNIGHHFHNELSGLYRIAASGILRPAVGLAGPHDHYGALSLFGLGADILKFGSATELTDLVLREGLFAIWPSDFAAQRGLAEGLLAQARRLPRSQRMEAALATVAAADLVIVIGLRSRRRVWLNGPAGLADILGRLEHRTADWPTASRIAVIFDGFTRTGSGGVEEEEFIARENAEIETLRSRPDFAFGGPVISAVGMTLYEKALLFSRADFAVCPKGNGHLPTLSWVTRTPAIVHSNSFEIGAAAGENAICDDAAPSIVMDRGAVMDILLPHVPWNRYAEQRGFAFEDYELDREQLWVAVRRLAISALARRRGTRVA